MSLRKLTTITQKLSYTVTSIPQRYLSFGNVLMQKYPRSYVDPEPDPKFYRKNLPLATDEIAFKPVKAAPTWQNYSIFYDEYLHKFERMLLKKGKSGVSIRMTRTMLEYIKSVQVKKYHRASEEEKQNIELNPLVIFHKAMDNAKPLLGLTKIAKGAGVYSVPSLLRPEKQFFLAFKNFQKHIFILRQNTNAGIRLGKEMMNAYNNEGAAVRSKQELHKQAYANRAYANLLASPLSRPYGKKNKNKRKFK